MTDSPENMKDSTNTATTAATGVPVAPSLGPALLDAKVPTRATLLDGRTIYITILAAIVGFISGFGALALKWLIRLITNVSFHGRFDGHTGIQYPLIPTHLWYIGIPVAGAIVIGFMARYGSRAVAGHGIPEAMEQVLTNESRIPPRLTFLKPVSAAISIGTGAPYGAEGPIIATGGALGSLLGQLLSTTAHERKVLLAAGASAGLCAAFNCPIAAVLMAVELLLFEFRARSLIPVAAATIVAAGIHVAFESKLPFFTFGQNAVVRPTHLAVALYVIVGCAAGIASVILTRTVTLIEELFEHIPIHWMWYPAIGAVFVGVIGYFVPQTFGSGYYNIDNLLANHLTIGFVAILGITKFLSWTISLGSGTAGGTLAPVFTMGGTVGALMGVLLNKYFPQAHVNVGMASLVGMVGIFAGASRAFLTSVIFAVETTWRPVVILPVLGGCTAAYLVSCLLMRHSIMTEKMVRHGVKVPEEYQPDFLDQVLVRDMMSTNLVTLRDNDSVQKVRQWFTDGGVPSNHQGFPILDENGYLVGVVTRRDVLAANSPNMPMRDLLRRPPVVVYDDLSLRDAANHMVNHDIGRLPVIDRDTCKLVGIITRSDVLKAHRGRLMQTPTRTLQLCRTGLRPVARRK